MIVQEDTIFVSGMSPETNEDEIANHFGAIGIIKVSANISFLLHFTFPLCEELFPVRISKYIKTHINVALISFAVTFRKTKER